MASRNIKIFNNSKNSDKLIKIEIPQENVDYV